ncbi:hypothetical protein DNK47_01615 [Mycoplasma wenyonii]|uniref:DUF2779 domain-containing protein n=1 Tax=Mycoplasma wenyonii TaxID=65123 RepID=A0A328PPL8_9MOLU|nr:DUF2779 domain-containing protein [Mycoplasma wenyonii]RAO95086.1 hypothetical protein DNK47_01615 [Mycoplasma wenyonii]
MNKAESSTHNKDFLTELLNLWNWKEKSQLVYLFQGTKEDWEAFLEHKRTSQINTFFIYEPKIQLKNFSGDGVDFILNPSGLLVSDDNFILFVFSYTFKPNVTYFPQFLFYSLSFQKYLEIEIKEFFIAWFDAGGELHLSNYLPSVKKLTKKSSPDYLKISRFLEVQSLTKNLPFEFEEKTFETTESFEKNAEKISEAIALLKEHFPERMKMLTQLASKLIQEVPENLEVFSDWYKHINWTNLLSLNSLVSNHQTYSQLKLFESSASAYRQALQLLYPNFEILSSSLVGFQKIFELIKAIDISSLPPIPEEKTFWDSFLIFCYSKFFEINLDSRNHSIFSIQGCQKLQKELLEIEWKVYYDFESYSETLTQLSLQIFQGKNLYLKENLILEDKEKLEEFEQLIITKLAYPILQLNWNFELAKQKIVYISFNKTFECEWLSKLSQKYKEKEEKLSRLAEWIRLLTIDLSDWFRFSKNLVLNLIGPLEGAHSLKKLTKLVSKKQYSEIELVQDGRTAQLLYFFFYLSEDQLDNQHLTSNNWVIPKESTFSLREQLKEYCELDVENMVLAVKWLEQQYKRQEECLVYQNCLLQFTSWFKSRSYLALSELIKDYINWKLS